ncbi:Phospholipase/carboxylesterase/thioesterase [Gautieria morchelliformis]|nr:Phospholipase/carboxylesterase/thioesterase [Gautieria morchelliformis]
MASLQPLKYLVVPPKVKHTATVIFLHGLGDSGAGWQPVAQMLQQDPALGHIKWVLPHAPPKHITLNLGMEMPAWYDIKSLTNIDTREEDQAGMLSTARSVNEIITSEIDALPDVSASRIVLGGFSQGAAMTLFTGLTTERKLGGLVALSSYLPVRDRLKSMLSEHVKKLPIFMGHGTADPMVALRFGKGSADYLKDQLGFLTVDSSQIAGPGVRFEQYERMGHSTSPEELDHLGAWLKVVLPQ